MSRSLKKATLIAEFKRKSPSRGILSEILDPLEQVNKYVEAGITAVSILTDEKKFNGSLLDMQKVALAHPHLVILRKDFITNLSQLEESVRCGATAVLLIVSVLGERTGEFLKAATDLGLEALVEVHNEKELAIALEAGAEIVGVNNRNLSTLKVDLHIAETLAYLLPNHVYKIAESGIHTQADARRMRALGYNSLLVGEALMKSNDPKSLIRELLL